MSSYWQGRLENCIEQFLLAGSLFKQFGVVLIARMALQIRDIFYWQGPKRYIYWYFEQENYEMIKKKFGQVGLAYFLYQCICHVLVGAYSGVFRGQGGRIIILP